MVLNSWLCAKHICPGYNAGAYQRPRLVTYECIIPKSKLSSGYRYRQARNDGQIVEAALPVGQQPWKKGTVASHLKHTDRSVYLSCWLMPTRRLSNAEVARMYQEILDRESFFIAIPENRSIIILSIELLFRVWKVAPSK